VATATPRREALDLGMDGERTPDLVVVEGGAGWTLEIKAARRDFPHRIHVLGFGANNKKITYRTPNFQNISI
jgi:hypothetical protein